MGRPRAADDFAAIRARMEELRREREAAHDTVGSCSRTRGGVLANMHTGRSARLARVRQSGPIRSSRSRAGVFVSA
jgi:hypothetical protein